MRSSQEAFDLIIAEEVSSKAAYERKYRKPEWPGASSGATVGIGYDLGQTAKATVTADWRGRVPNDMLTAMVSACGATGAAGRTATARIRNAVDIPWDIAIAVHKECVVPRWEARVAAALPNTDKLSPDCFGVLLSLTFNRGPSFSTSGARYVEMRAIKKHMAAEDFAAIPAEFRAMKRLWPDLAGLRRRRDTEAKLFARGLAKPAETVKQPEFAAKTAELTIKFGGEAAVVVPKPPPTPAPTSPVPVPSSGDGAKAGASGGIAVIGTAAAVTAHNSGVRPGIVIGIVVVAVLLAIIGWVVVGKVRAQSGDNK